ncbi:hypothetical protein [Streptomyces sp. SGAir0957]
MSDRNMLILFATAHVFVFAIFIAVIAGYLARRDRASYPAAVAHAATAFTGTLLLVATVVTTLVSLNG